MRILHTNFLRGWGGQSNRILVKCRGLMERGHDVTISAPPGSELVRRAREAGVPVCDTIGYRGPGRSGFLADVRAMKRLAEQFQPEILHLHGGHDSWTAAAACIFGTLPGRPVILRTKHNCFPISGHPLNRWMYGRFFEAIVCISTAIVEQFKSLGYVDPGRLYLVPSACDAGHFVADADARAAIRAEFGLQPGDVVIAMTGRLRPEKGHRVLLEAAPAIVAKEPRVRFLLLGSGSMHGDLKQLIDRHRLDAHVVLAGFRTDIPACLAAADLYVQPSLSEGLGTSVLEACAAGLPVVASRTGGIPDIVIHESSGLLVETGSSPQLAEAVCRLLADAGLRARLGDAARRHVAETFSIDALVGGSEEVYRSVLERFRGQTAIGART